MKLVVINKSNRPLTSDETSLLAKGGNFSVTPSTIPTEEIIANIEAGIERLPDDVKEELRSESARILRKAKPPKCNISRGEKAAIKSLNADETIIILPADKGNATVVLNTSDYRNKLNNLVSQETYRRLQKDPTEKILRKTNQLIKGSSLPTETKKKLCRSEALPPRLYGLPKIHKEDVPLRPISSAIGSPTYNLDKHLSDMLQKHVGKTRTYVRDSTHFIEQLKEITLEPNDILVSFDIVSLFTNVPLEESLSYIEEIFPQDINLFRHSLTTTYFQWNETFYEQVDGVAMGSPLSPVVANFYMEKFEERAIRTSEKQPKHWLRYVDDTFVVWSYGREELQNFLNHLNSFHPKIQFTMELEENLQIPFLDVLVTKEGNHLGHKVYRKKTHTDRYLHNGSNHHPKQKRTVINTLVNRALRICEPRHIDEEMKHLTTVLQANGYNKKDIIRATRPREKRRNTNEEQPQGTVYLPYIEGVTNRIGKILKKEKINTVFKPTKKISEYLRSAKDSRDPLKSAGVYRIPCNCGKVYIGQTKRSIGTRLVEHKRSCRLGQSEKSAVAEHTLSDGEHKILFENTERLATSNHYSTRMYLEAIEIHKHQENFNRKEERTYLPKIWHTALKEVKTKPCHPNRAESAREPAITEIARQNITINNIANSKASVSVDTSRRVLRPRH